MKRHQILAVYAAAIAVLCVLPCCAPRKTSSRSIVYVDAQKGDEVVRSGAGQILGVGEKTPGIWVDSRNPDEYAAAHVPGAINIPFQKVTLEQDRMRGYGALVVYGRDYNDPRAEGMTKRMLDLGFENVHLMRGGFRAWLTDGRPVEGDDVVDGVLVEDE